MGSSQAIAQTVYYKNDMHFDLFFKWLWYFEYRAALLKVANPKNYVKLLTGSYAYTLPKDDYIKKLKDNIKARKGTVTGIKNKMALAKKHWAFLFPIEEDPDWKKAEELLNKKILLLKEAEDELKNTLNGTSI
jgi:hypothetical protein